MGYLKHIYGDDMTPDERARLDHAELVELIANHGECPTATALTKFHDRHYGSKRECTWCQEPARERAVKALKTIEAAFARPPADPQPREPQPASNGSRIPNGVTMLGLGDPAEAHALLAAMFKQTLGRYLEPADPQPREPKPASTDTPEAST